MENPQRNEQPTASSNASAGRRKPDPKPEPSGTESMSTEWTDEKHSMYLKSMEASFVNQLHDSLDLIACHLQIEQSSSPSRKLYKPASSSSGQFKVLRHGFWHELNFTRSGLRQNKVNKSHCVLTNPWIKHFKCTTKTQGHEATSLKGKGSIPCAIGADIEHPSQCWSQFKVGDININSVLEVSDQNFEDGIEEGKNAGKGSDCGAKRIKTREARTPSVNQVVRVGKSPMNADVPKACASSGG